MQARRPLLEDVLSAGQHPWRLVAQGQGVAVQLPACGVAPGAAAQHGLLLSNHARPRPEAAYVRTDLPQHRQGVRLRGHRRGSCRWHGQGPRPLGAERLRGQGTAAALTPDLLSGSRAHSCSPCFASMQRGSTLGFSRSVKVLSARCEPLASWIACRSPAQGGLPPGRSPPQSPSSRQPCARGRPRPCTSPATGPPGTGAHTSAGSVMQWGSMLSAGRAWA